MNQSHLTINNQPEKIYIYDYPDLNNINKKLSNFIKKIGDCQGYKTNVKAKMTNWNISSSEIDIIKNLILDNFYKINFWHTSHKFEIFSIWGNIYHKNDYTIIHDHSPWYFSCVYFVKCNPKSSPLIFSYDKLEVSPKEGRMILFPSYLKHEVPIQKFNDERITLSANINFLP